MHDKPTIDNSLPIGNRTRLEDLIADLGAADPADAPPIADAVAAHLERRLSAAATPDADEAS